MSLIVELDPQIEARVNALAHQQGVELSLYVKRFLAERLPAPRVPQGPRAPENDPTLALLKSWMDQAPTDPEKIREAEQDLLQFKRNMNANRRAEGAEILYLDVE